MSDTACTDMAVSKAAIKASPLGDELSDTQCELLASVMTACGIRDQGFLIEEDQKDDCLHVLTKGNMEVVSHAAGGEKVGLQILRAGDILGELGFLDGVEHSAGVRAMGNCELLRLDRASFESLLEKDPDLVYKVMRGIFRITHTNLMRVNLESAELKNYVTKTRGRY